MHTEATRRFIYRYIEEVWHNRNLDAAEREFWHPEIKNRYAPEYPNGIDGLKKQLLPIFGAFSDLRIEIEDLLIDDDMVAARLTVRLTHSGPFAGIPATGKRASFHAALWQRVKDAKLHDFWLIADWSSLYDQLQND